jgi:hypothetical protein
MPVIDGFSFLGQYNGFEKCIPEITSIELDETYGDGNWSCGSLEWISNFYYNIYEVTFTAPDGSDPPLWIPDPDVYGAAIPSPIEYPQPKTRLCNHQHRGFPDIPNDIGIQESGVSWLVWAGLTLPVPTKITDLNNCYLFKQDFVGTGLACFRLKETSTETNSILLDVISYINMHSSPLGSQTPPDYVTQLDGKTFWGSSIDFAGGGPGAGAGILPEITSVTFYGDILPLS